MTIKELKKHYKVETYDRGKTLHLFHLTERGTYNVRKYIASLEKVDNGRYKMYGTDPITARTNLNEILEKISDTLNSYEFNSEFYNPMFREGYFEELVIHNHLQNLGFKTESTVFDIEVFKKVNTDGSSVILYITGLILKRENDLVSISCDNADGSTLSGDVKYDIHKILDLIDSIVKFKYTSSLVSILPTVSNLSITTTDFSKKELIGLNIKEDKSIKKELIKELEKVLTELKK